MTYSHRATALLLTLVLAPAAPAQTADTRKLDEHYRRAAALSAQGKWAEALPEYERALVLARAVYGPNHRETGVALAIVGGSHFRLGDLPRAEAELVECLRILGREPGAEGADAAQIRGLLGSVYLGLK
jgi:hypothetical protein